MKKKGFRNNWYCRAASRLSAVSCYSRIASYPGAARCLSFEPKSGPNDLGKPLPTQTAAAVLGWAIRGKGVSHFQVFVLNTKVEECNTLLELVVEVDVVVVIIG